MKHHCFTRASCNLDDGNSAISGDIGPVGDNQLWLSVDDEDEETEVLTEEVSEGGSGEATLRGVDRGEECSDANMGMLCLKMGAEMSILNLISFDQIRRRAGLLTFRFWLRMKCKWLGYFLQAARTTAWRGGRLDRGSNPDGRGDKVDQFLRSRGKSDAPRDAATLNQGEPRDLIRLIGRRRFPQGGRQQGERKRRQAWKHRRDLGEGKDAGLDRKTGGDGSGPHRA